MTLRATFLSLAALATVACSSNAPTATATGTPSLPDASSPQSDASSPLADAGDAGSTTSPTDASAPFDGPDLDMQPSDFECILRWTKVGDFRITNKVEDAGASIAVAEDDAGGRYPVGTIIQLIPNEAIVKRHIGFDPSLNDWEFFNLSTSASGTVINQRGGAEVTNVSGSCANCHGQAAPQYDFVCATTHGCTPLPFTETEILAIQNGDPRCP